MYILLTLHILFNPSSAVILFTDTMQSHIEANWPINDQVGDIRFGHLNNCHSVGGCARLRTSNGDASITSSTIDSTNIENIHLQFDISVRGLKDSDSCTVQYSIDNGLNYKITATYGEIDNFIPYLNTSRNLTDASNHNIKLYILQDASDTNNKCFLSNIIVTGDAPPTSTPTTVTDAPTTNAPTTDASTTNAPTTNAPTTNAPTTNAPTTNAPTTNAPTTNAPTTNAPTADAPTTNAPTTDAPTTNAPTTNAPTTNVPTTDTPTTNAPTTNAPTTSIPTTVAPTTIAPTTNAPTTDAPTTSTPTNNPITTSPTTSLPTTNNPTTNAPTTSIPTTNNPTTVSPTTSSPTTQTPTTSNPTTVTPTATPITSFPTTSNPTTNSPITPMPTTSNPTTSMPTTSAPVTTSPTSSMPTTSIPTTNMPTTSNPTPTNPITYAPTTSIPTTASPVTVSPTTSIPTTTNPTTVAPTTINPTTNIPTTTAPTPTLPTTTAPTTDSPTTISPITSTPTTNTPTTSSPTTNPITNTPTTTNPTSNSVTSNPTTVAPTTTNPTTSIPTISIPTTINPTSQTTKLPTTTMPTTISPITSNPTTTAPTTFSPTTIPPTTTQPTTISPTPSNPVTADPTTSIPTTNSPSTTKPTTMSPSTTNPTTDIPTTTSPTPSLPTTSIPSTSNPTTHTPTTAAPTTINPTTNIPTTISPTPSLPTTSTPSTSNPTTNTPTTTQTTPTNPTTSVPTTNQPTTISPITSTPTSSNPTTTNPTTVSPTTNTPTTTDPHTLNPSTFIPTTVSPTTNAPSTHVPTSSNPTTTNPTTSLPTSSPETHAPTTNPTPITTDEDNQDEDEDIEQSQLKLKSSNGECDFECWECLQQVDITGRSSTAWDLLFNSFNNDTNCSCPNEEGTTNDGETINVGTATDAPQYELEIEKYRVSDEETDDGTVEYGLRVNVKYWASVKQTCKVEYTVNQNEFLGVQAQNILTIAFTVCGVDFEGQTREEYTTAQQIEYNEMFAMLFDIDISQINATIELGYFCQERRRRNLLEDGGNDEEVTVVIIFHDAEDAKAAETHGCDLLIEKNPNVGPCETQVHTKDEIDDTNDVYQHEKQSNDNIFIGIIVVAIVLCSILILTFLYCYFSYQKREKKKRIREEYENIRKKSSNASSHTNSARSSIDDCVTRSRRDSSHERGKSEKIVTFEPVVLSKQCSTEIEMTEQKEKKHYKFMESMQINLDVTIRLNDLPTNQEGKLVILQEDKTDNIDMEVVIENNMAENEMNAQEIMEQLIDTNEIDSRAANEIEYEDLIIDKQIGNGHFGEVYKANWEGNLVVLKQLKHINEKEELNEKEEELKREIILATSLPPHQNLVEVFGYINSPMFGIVMRYMSGDSVEKYCYRKYKTETDQIPSLKEILIILTKSACGFKFLHEYGLIHRDIACRNILLGNMNSNMVDISTEVRVSDFGLSRQLKHKQMEQKSKTNFGPVRWMAPESIKAKKYSKKSDVYMFGCTMWEIFYGMEPYENEDIVNTANLCLDIVRNGKRPLIEMENKPNGQYKHIQMPLSYVNLMELCWSTNTNDRPAFQQIISKITKIVGNPLQSDGFWD